MCWRSISVSFWAASPSTGIRSVGWPYWAWVPWPPLLLRVDQRTGLTRLANPGLAANYQVFNFPLLESIGYQGSRLFWNFWPVDLVSQATVFGPWFTTSWRSAQMIRHLVWSIPWTNVPFMQNSIGTFRCRQDLSWLLVRWPLWQKGCLLKEAMDGVFLYRMVFWSPVFSHGILSGRRKSQELWPSF